MRALQALLAATLALALVAVPVGTATTADAPLDRPAPQVQQADGNSIEGPVEVLALADDVANRSARQDVVIDVGPAVATATTSSSHELLTRRAVARVRTADDPRAALGAELDRIAARTDALGRSQRSTLRSFAEGGDEADARATLVALAKIDRTARALDERRSRVVDAARQQGVDVPADRSAALARELAIYTGPVRERVGAAMSGDAPPTRAFVSTTPRGVMLATLTESGYVRETYRGELRRTSDTALNQSVVRDVVATAYPTVWDARRSVNVDSARLSTARVTYDGGELAATVGSSNRRVFRDIHRQSLGVAGTDQQAINTRDGLRLFVNRSYVGGPMKIRLETVDGEPVDANLTVGPEGGDSTPVGTTGPDGERWVLTPGNRFTVVAIRGNSVVFITMDPLPAPQSGPP